MNRFFRFLSVSIFFIGFPLISWYYLNQGYNYRMAVIAELENNLGETPDFQLINQKEKKVGKKNMKKNVVISNFVSLNEIDQSKDYMEKLYKIQDQFDKKDDILFYTYIKADNLSAIQTYCKNLNIKEEKQWHFLTGSEQEMEQFIQTFPFPTGTQKLYAANPIVAIADTSSVIRHFYDLNNSKEVIKLIEHIAKLMPQAPPGEARTKRELEK